MRAPWPPLIRTGLGGARPFHPYVFGVWFVLEGVHSLPGSRLSSILAALLLLLAGVAVLHIGLSFVFRDVLKNGLATTLVLAPVLYFEQAQRAVMLLSPTLAGFRYFVPMLLLATAGGMLFLQFTPRSLRSVEWGLNITTLLFVVMSFGLLLLRAEPTTAESVPPLPTAHVRSHDHGPFSSDRLPDVYYILLDAYTDSASLRVHWGFDNHAFLDGLRHRGFAVMPQSRSHYTSTARSLAASLTMDTLPTVAHPFAMIRSSVVPRLFRARGYALVNLSPFEIDGTTPFYSIFNDDGESARGIEDFFRNTGVVYALATVRAQSLPAVNLRILDSLRNLPPRGTGAPRFVYAHLLTPHGPFGFDRSGAIIPPMQRGGWKDRWAYLDQLIGTNALVLPVIDVLLARPGPDPIIIVQGDHGSRLFTGEEGRREGHTILNAYHLPDRGDRFLSPAISPVNSFRVVANHLFDLGLPSAQDYRDPELR